MKERNEVLLMGRDIHCRLVKTDGTVICSDMYDGRNYEWFDNLMERGDNAAYDHIDWNYGLYENCIEMDKDSDVKKYGYGFRWISAKDYIDWYTKYEPQRDAGYLTEYELWAYNHHRFNPFGNGIPHYMPTDTNEKYIFCEVENKYCPDTGIVDKILKYTNEMELDKYVLYLYFDS